MSEMFDATKACAVCGYPAPDHSALCSAWRPGVVEMCPCGDMTDRECREANRKAAEASGSVCCARFRDSADTPSPPARGGEEAVLGEFGFKASMMAPSQMDALLNMARVVTDLRARLVAAERAGAAAASELPTKLGDSAI